jgi:hypothetical protein
VLDDTLGAAPGAGVPATGAPTELGGLAGVVDDGGGAVDGGDAMGS